MSNTVNSSFRCYLLREYQDGTIERSYHSQIEAFQLCSQTMVNAVIKKRKTGLNSLKRVEWGIEYSTGETEAVESHIM